MKLLAPAPTTPDQEATLWLVRAQSGLTPEESARFDLWQQQPANAAAYAKVQADWTILNTPRRKGQARALQAAVDRRIQRSRLRWLGTVTLAAAAGLALFFILPRYTPEKTPSVAFKPDKQHLPDGSTVELNAGANIAVDFSGSDRKVTLLQGEALFAVAKNPARPFTVTAGSVHVTAVGTAFTVRQTPAGVRVLVTEGQVRVTQDNHPSPLFVTAREEVLVSATPAIARPVGPVQIARELAWRGKRVEFTDTPLPEAIALFNQQNPIHLELADASLTEVRLNGIYWADDPEGFVRLLEDGLGLKAVPTDRGVALRKQ